MECKTCKEIISSKMKNSLKMNLCPFCGGKVMEPQKAKQYTILMDVMNSLKFTNKEEVDTQIKEKVIGVLAENFEFTAIIKKKREDDLIVVDDIEEKKASVMARVVNRSGEEEEIEEVEAELPPARSMSEAAQASGKVTSKAPSKVELNKLSKMYERMAEENYSSPQAEDDESDEEKVSYSSSAKDEFFLDGIPPEMADKVEKLRAKKMDQVQGNGIRRVSR